MKVTPIIPNKNMKNMLMIRTSFTPEIELNNAWTAIFKFLFLDIILKGLNILSILNILMQFKFTFEMESDIIDSVTIIISRMFQAFLK